MFNYTVQFRQVCVATTDVNSTIKHIFLSWKPMGTRNPTYNPIY